MGDTTFSAALDFLVEVAEVAVTALEGGDCGGGAFKAADLAFSAHDSVVEGGGVDEDGGGGDGAGARATTGLGGG